jgi:hypothetical protein
MYFMGHQLYEWDDELDRRMIHIAQHLCSQFHDSPEVITVAQILVPDRVKRKQEFIDTIKGVLLDRKIRKE